jgi:hypothetical protein
MRGAVVLATATLASIGCIGCRGNDEGGKIAYKRATVEAFLRAEVARTSPGMPIGQVTCPDQLPGGVGASTFCAVEIDGVTTSYVVQVLAGKRFEARPEHPIVDLRTIATQITEKAGAGATVTCGPKRIVQLTPEQRVVCAITGGGPDRRAVVTADPDGTIRVADL